MKTKSGIYVKIILKFFSFKQNEEIFIFTRIYTLFIIMQCLTDMLIFCTFRKCILIFEEI